MSFIGDFIFHSVLAALVAVVLFGMPGLVVLRLLGLLTRQRIFTALLVAPVIGLCTYGPFSLVFVTVFDYSVLTILAAWLIFQILVLLWLRQQATLITAEDFYTLPYLHTLLLLLGAGLCAILPTINIFPAVHQDALFVNAPIFDHAKIAIVDSIAREGMLPQNPYYAPAGETIQLIYYYTWHFLVSQLKMITAATGWQAEVAMSWFTGFSCLGFLCGLAIRMTRKTRAGFFVLLFSLTGPPALSLPKLLGPGSSDWVGFPPGHSLELWLIQMSWAPQHVFSAIAVIVLIFLLARLLSCDHMQCNYIPVVGLAGAAAFGASAWVGGVALLLSLPFLVLSVLRAQLPKQHYYRTLKMALLALPVCVLFSMPLLISQTSGPSLTNSSLPFGLWIYTATSLFHKESFMGVAHIVLFWLQFLPLSLGVIYILGCLAVLARSSTVLEERVFQVLSIGGIFGFMLIAQFVESTIMNNDLGWRSVLVPVMLLLVWSAIALTELSSRRFTETEKWRSCAWIVKWRHAVLPLTIVGLMIGILSTAYSWRLAGSDHHLLDESTIAIRQGFLRQRDAWAKVREYATPTDLVQSNPDGYSTLTPWPVTLPLMLFADRSTAYANPGYVQALAYRYNTDKKAHQYQLVQNVFSSQPTESAIRSLRDVLNIKVLLVDKYDAVWNSNAIERSGLYRLVHSNEDYKIYVTMLEY